MKRGRPLKFGRPAQLLAIRLPENAVRALNHIHPDPAWAIVSLIDGAGRGHRKTEPAAPPVVELVKVGRQSLIVVDQAAVTAIPGVDIIPLSGGRAFLALDPGRGMSDLELAVNDRLIEQTLNVSERATLKTLSRQLREWRRSGELAFRLRSIIVAEPMARTVRGRRHSPRRSEADPLPVAQREPAERTGAPVGQARQQRRRRVPKRPK